MAATFTNLLYHIVFSTKDRRPLITSDVKQDLYNYVGGILRNQRGTLLEINGMPDHIHVVASLKADVSVAVIVRLIKANSSRWLNLELGRPRSFAWQTGYGAFSVSESQLNAVRKYVRDQEKHHRRLSFQEEFLVLLRKNGLVYDEASMWR